MKSCETCVHWSITRVSKHDGRKLCACPVPIWAIDMGMLENACWTLPGDGAECATYAMSPGHEERSAASDVLEAAFRHELVEEEKAARERVERTHLQRDYWDGVVDAYQTVRTSIWPTAKACVERKGT